MAGFNEAFDKTFLYDVLSWSEEINNEFFIKIRDFQRSTVCWSNMRKLGFSDSEILAYVKCFWCQEVWDEIGGDKINSQELAESMFTFSLTNGADHCLHLLNLTLKLKGGQSLLEGVLENINHMSGDELLLKFGMAKVIYYDLSDKYLSQQGKPA